MFDIRKIQEKVIYDSVSEVSNDKKAREIVYGKDDNAKEECNSDWVQSTMGRLEKSFDFDTVKKIRMNCQCGYGMDEKVALINELKLHSSSIEELVSFEKAKAAGLFCRDGELYLQFNFCPCPMVAEVKKLETSTWCQCTTGYSKALFEKAFKCTVDVELLKSIKMGDECCLMKITLNNPVW